MSKCPVESNECAIRNKCTNKCGAAFPVRGSFPFSLVDLREYCTGIFEKIHGQPEAFILQGKQMCAAFRHLSEDPHQYRGVLVSLHDTVPDEALVLIYSEKEITIPYR